MPRSLPRLDLELGTQITAARAFVKRIEIAQVSASVPKPDALRLHDVELAYELAYLRVFLAWELFLEAALLRLMCGYCHAHGQEPLKAGRSYERTLADAEMTVLNGQAYKLWHNPSHVISRASIYFNNSHFEQVIASAQSRITHFAAVRHRIAHDQKDAQIKFDTATMTIAGKRYLAARPGRFLRDMSPAQTPPKRWLEILCSELETLARQICT